MAWHCVAYVSLYHCGICILPIHLCLAPCSIGLGAGRVRTAWAGGEVPRTNRPLAIHIHTMPPRTHWGSTLFQPAINAIFFCWLRQTFTLDFISLTVWLDQIWKQWSKKTKVKKIFWEMLWREILCFWIFHERCDLVRIDSYNLGRVRAPSGETVPEL